MNRYAILNSRKRAIIALVHSVFFLIVALMSFLGHAKAGVLFIGVKAPSDLALLGIYGVVSGVLITLVTFSICARERLYFLFCATSASFGFLRMLLGDTHLFIAQYVRVLMLISACAMCYWILRQHSNEELAESATLASYE